VTPVARDSKKYTTPLYVRPARFLTDELENPSKAPDFPPTARFADHRRGDGLLYTQKASLGRLAFFTTPAYEVGALVAIPPATFVTASILLPLAVIPVALAAA
jgi:hypothetical protein